MPLIDVPDIAVYYQTEGRGPRLLYIGGSGSNLRRPPAVFDSPLPGRSRYRHTTSMASSAYEAIAAFLTEA